MLAGIVASVQLLNKYLAKPRYAYPDPDKIKSAEPAWREFHRLEWDREYERQQREYFEELRRLEEERPRIAPPPPKAADPPRSLPLPSTDRSAYGLDDPLDQFDSGGEEPDETEPADQMPAEVAERYEREYAPRAAAPSSIPTTVFTHRSVQGASGAAQYQEDLASRNTQARMRAQKRHPLGLQSNIAIPGLTMPYRSYARRGYSRAARSGRFATALYRGRSGYRSARRSRRPYRSTRRGFRKRRNSRRAYRSIYSRAIGY